MGLNWEGRASRKEEEAVDVAAERLAGIAVDAGLKIHRLLGPGLLESAYEQFLARELALRGVPVSRQVAIPVSYEGMALDVGYRIDLLLADRLILEIKAVETLTRLHEAQLRTYLRLSGRHLGLLMNFNALLFKDGLRRISI